MSRSTSRIRFLLVHLQPFVHLCACLTITLAPLESGWQYLIIVDAPASVLIVTLIYSFDHPVIVFWNRVDSMVVSVESWGRDLGHQAARHRSKSPYPTSADRSLTKRNADRNNQTRTTITEFALSRRFGSLASESDQRSRCRSSLRAPLKRTGPIKRRKSSRRRYPHLQLPESRADTQGPPTISTPAVPRLNREPTAPGPHSSLVFPVTASESHRVPQGYVLRSTHFCGRHRQEQQSSVHSVHDRLETMRPGPMCRKKISPFRAQYLPLSFLANLTDGLIDNGRLQRACSKNPDALFLVSRGIASHWTQHDVILERLHFQ
jgi:hypothetical protein